MGSAILLAAAGSASWWHRRAYVLLPVAGGDLAHGLRVRRFARGNGCNVRRGFAEELLDDWHTMFATWARWATTVVLAWPDDISRAEPDLDAIRDLIARRIARTATRPEDT